MPVIVPVERPWRGPRAAQVGHRGDSHAPGAHDDDVEAGRVSDARDPTPDSSQRPSRSIIS